MNRTIRLTALALAAAPVLLTSLPASAAPKDSYSSRSSGVAATAQWVQRADLTAAGFGNVHVGHLYAMESSEGRADVYAFIEDFTCPDGVYPGGHGELNGCEQAGSRKLDGNVEFVVGRRVSSATVNGFLTARTAGDPHTGEGGSTIGSVPANFTWTATGDPVRTRSTYRWQQGSVSGSDTYSSLSAPATLSGVLGPMLFEEAHTATGSIDQFTYSSRQRG